MICRVIIKEMIEMKNSTRIGIIAGVFILIMLFMPAQAYTGFIVKNTPKGSLTYQFVEITKLSPAYKVTDFRYDFGDGTNSTSHNPVHTYSQPGTYDAVLRIAWQDSSGNKYTSSTLAEIIANGVAASTSTTIVQTSATPFYPTSIPVSLATQSTPTPTKNVTPTVKMPFDVNSDPADPSQYIGQTIVDPDMPGIPFVITTISKGLGYAGLVYVPPH